MQEEDRPIKVDLDLTGVAGSVGLQVAGRKAPVEVVLRWPIPAGVNDKMRWKYVECRVEGVALEAVPLLLEIAADSLHQTIRNQGEVETIEEPAIGPEQGATKDADPVDSVRAVQAG